MGGGTDQCLIMASGSSYNTKTHSKLVAPAGVQPLSCGAVGCVSKYGGLPAPTVDALTTNINFKNANPDSVGNITTGIFDIKDTGLEIGSNNMRGSSVARRTSPNLRRTDCPKTCNGKTCDDWFKINSYFTCHILHTVYSCDCVGCSGDPSCPPPITPGLSDTYLTPI